MKVHAAVTSPVVTLVRAAMLALPRAILALTVGIALLPSSSEAVTGCKVHLSSKTGLIDVFASGVSGPLLWGDRSGSESLTFANAGTCIAGASASKCEFGAPGSVQAITPPDLCTVYMKDSGPECAVYIKGCTPGPRFTDQAKADALAQLVAALSFHHSVPTIEFSGVNVQIDSGSGTTAGATNGAGNLIIGYNEQQCRLSGGTCATDGDCPANPCIPGMPFGDCTFGGFLCLTNADCPPNVCPQRDGSHNLVVGPDHSYSSYGGLVAGIANAINGPDASVSGGNFNTASGLYASVSGGHGNTASGEEASVSGGDLNTASDIHTSVSGGLHNTASRQDASVSGGIDNTASQQWASVSGGQCNVAGPGPASCFEPSSTALSVSGGTDNLASGNFASVSGGLGNTVSGAFASVSGGEGNTASGTVASVSGGTSLTAAGFSEWHSGESAGFPNGTEY
jgi:hypothetical protein